MMETLNKLIDVIMVTVVLVVISLTGYIFFDAQIVSSSAELKNDIKIARSDKKNDDINFEALQELNRNIVGWIQIDDTDIDYPILQADDNQYYLSRDYRNAFATAGSIFLDYRDNIATDDFLVIYGHRMSQGKMFSDVTKFENKDFFNNHPTGKLYTVNEQLDLVIVGFAKVDANEKEIYGVHRNANKIVDFLKKEAIYWSDFESERYALLSTCDSRDKSKRDVLLLSLKE